MHFLLNITNLITTYGYLGIFVIVFLESGIFFALPGDTLLFTVGIIASSGGFAIGTLILLIFLATFLGGLFGYYIGINIEKLHKYKFFKKIIKKENLSRAHNFFKKYGIWAIVFSRFVPVVRTFAPIVAGLAKMNYASFVRYSIISSILWSTLVTFIGYFLGNNFPWIQEYITFIMIGVVFLSVLPIALQLIRKKI